MYILSSCVGDSHKRYWLGRSPLTVSQLGLRHRTLQREDEYDIVLLSLSPFVLLKTKHKKDVEVKKYNAKMEGRTEVKSSAGRPMVSKASEVS